MADIGFGYTSGFPTGSNTGYSVSFGNSNREIHDFGSAKDYGLDEDLMSRALNLAQLKNNKSSGKTGHQLLAEEIEKVRSIQDARETAKTKVTAATSGTATADGGSGGPSAANLANTQLSTSFSGIADEGDRAAIRSMIVEMAKGGMPSQKEAKADRQGTLSQIDMLAKDYSKRSAFEDALGAITQQINKSMEANKPAIQRAVEGAGTSAGSMQALLSQRLSTDAASQASALGAEQAKAYGQIQAQLLGTRAGLTRGDDPTMTPLLQAIDLLKVSKSQSTGTGYFSPSQMVADTQADKLARIDAEAKAKEGLLAAENKAAQDRLTQQLAAQEKNVNAQLDAQVAASENAALANSYASMPQASTSHIPTYSQPTASKAGGLLYGYTPPTAPPLIPAVAAAGAITPPSNSFYSFQNTTKNDPNSDSFDYFSPTEESDPYAGTWFI